MNGPIRPNLFTTELPTSADLRVITSPAFIYYTFNETRITFYCRDIVTNFKMYYEDGGGSAGLRELRFRKYKTSSNFVHAQIYPCQRQGACQTCPPVHASKALN